MGHRGCVPPDGRFDATPHGRSAGASPGPGESFAEPVTGANGLHRYEEDQPMAKDIWCAFGVDVDAVAGWLGSYGGADSPLDISRGMFSGEVGTPRLVKLFERFGIKTTWFVPGHSMETFPEQIGMVVAAGHEIGIHGYSHENPIAMTRAQEEAVLDKCIDVAQKLTGRRPTGYVAPWWEFSPVPNDLLPKRGFKYEHGLMHHDFQPHYVRVGDRWTKIDYSKNPRDRKSTRLNSSHRTISYAVFCLKKKKKKKK